MLTRRTLTNGFLALPLAAPAIAQNRQTEITIYHYQNDKRGDVFKDIIRRFEASNPDVKVNDIFKTDATITAELQSALAARRPVDLGTVIGIRVQFYRMRAPVVAFDEDLAQARWLENYLPNFLDVGRHGGKVYAVPYAEGFPYVKPVIAQMRDTVATETWNHANALQAENIVSTMVDDLWAGKGPASQLVPEAVKRANAALSRPN